MATVSELPIVFDAIDFCAKQNLSLKPLAKIEIFVKLPKITVPGQSISNWDLMERLKKLVAPILLEGTRVKESSLEMVIFEAELVSRTMMKQAIKMFDNKTMKVSGFAEPVTITAVESKHNFPSRHDWDAFYMKNHLNENNPGERPDTMYLAKVPVKWFNNEKVDGPSEYLLEEAMSTFGKVRMVDIPICDPYRMNMPAKIAGFQNKGFGFGLGQEVLFEAYVQYEEYKGFSTAMDALRNMKWVKEIDGKMFQANVKVDFDRNKHLCNGSIKARQTERDRIVSEKNKELQAKLKIEQDARRKQKMEEEKAQLAEHKKERRRAEREEKRRRRYEEEKQREEERRKIEKELRRKQRGEEEAIRRKTQERILEATRLLDFAFDRIREREERKREANERLIQAEMELLEDGELQDDDRLQLLRQVLVTKMELKKNAQRLDEEDSSRREKKLRKEKKKKKSKHSHRRSRSRSRSPYRRRKRKDSD